jgi:urease accessory protein
MVSKSLLPSSVTLPPWRAAIHLRAEASEDGTTVRRRHAEGPLQIQKVLYPEGDDVAHVFLLHPPSGIAQEDELDIQIEAVEFSHSLYATPGATRWYKSSAEALGPSVQRTRLSIQSGSTVEWLPYENLYFDHTWAENHLTIQIETGSRLLGWDLHQFGRTSCHEPWAGGRVHNALSLYLDDQLFWTETGHWTQGSIARPDDHHHLGAFSIAGSLWAYGPTVPDEHYETMAASLPHDDICIAGLSQINARRTTQQDGGTLSSDAPLKSESLVVMRFLSSDPERAREVCERTRAALRPLMIGKSASDLRIWAT